MNWAILLVEDDRRLAANWQQVLEGAGHRVVHENTVEGAVDALDEMKFDLVITDIVIESDGDDVHMAGGLAVISYIALNVNPQPQIIAVSGAGSQSIFVDKNFKRMQAFRALRKPVDDARLLQVVEEVFHQPAPPAPVDKQAMYTSQAMWELLGATDGVWDWRVGSDEVIFAPGFRKLLGFDENDLSGFPNRLESLTDRFHPEDRQRILDSINQSLNLRKPFVLQYRLRTKQDGYIWVRSRATASFDDEGRAIRMVGSTHDITEQVQAIEERGRFFHLAVDLFAVFDIEKKKCIRFSPAWSDTLGYTPEEMIQAGIWECFHPDDRPSALKAIDQLKRQERIRGLVLRLKTRSGQYRFLEANAEASSPPSSLWYITARDITDTEEHLFRIISAALPQMMYLYDVDRKSIAFGNRQLQTFLNDSPDQDQGRLWLLDRVAPEDVNRVSEHYAAVAEWQEGKVYQIDYCLRLSDGTYEHCSSRDTVFRRSGTGQVQQFLGTVTNFGELETLKRYAEDLENANSDLASFAYVASHDLKQPLRGIQHLANWIQEDCGEVLPPASKEHLQKLVTRVDRMEGLLSDLLVYALAGKTPQQEEHVEIDRLVDNLREILAPPSTFETNYQGPKLVLQTDRVSLEQVLRNLVGNAIKYRSRDDGFVRVEARKEKLGVVFRVVDNGIGIESGFHDRIFRMFTKLHTQEAAEGSGIGLALVKKIVELRGGSISVGIRTRCGNDLRSLLARSKTSPVTKARVFRDHDLDTLVELVASATIRSAGLQARKSSELAWPVRNLSSMGPWRPWPVWQTISLSQFTGHGPMLLEQPTQIFDRPELACVNVATHQVAMTTKHRMNYWVFI